MTDTDGAVDRFADHFSRLQKIGEGGAKIEGPSAVGEVLTMSGNLLRRSQSLQVNATVVDRALRNLEPNAVHDFLRTLDPATLCQKIEQAHEDAFEALLAETPEERSLFVESALEGLRARDRLASVRAALAWTDRPTAEVDAIARAVDRKIASRGRMLVALNEARRAELALLDDDAKKESFWFSSRSSCDALAAVYSGKAVDEAHLASCEACRKDAAAAGHSKKPKHLDGRALERLEAGTASAAEKQWAERHVDGCASCARAVAALAAVDVATVDAS